MKKIDHIGIAVDDFKAIKDILNILKIQNHHSDIVEDQKVETLSFILGESEIELLKPISVESPITKYIVKKGIGIHHIAIKVDNLEKEIIRLVEAGIKMIDEKPRIGAGNKRIAFIHPQSSGGILLELIE